MFVEQILIYTYVAFPLVVFLETKYKIYINIIFKGQR